MINWEVWGVNLNLPPARRRNLSEGTTLQSSVRYDCYDEHNRSSRHSLFPEIIEERTFQRRDGEGLSPYLSLPSRRGLERRGNH